MKKNFLFLVIHFIGIAIHAQTTYYISVSGNDANSGTSTASPWKTLNKVQTEWNAGRFNAGDNILFNRGDYFKGSLDLNNDGGTEHNPITIGAYGTGELPVITGGDTVNGTWNNQGNNIWSIQLGTSYSRIYFLKINGRKHVVGREPDNGEMDVLTGYSGTSIINDSKLNNPDDYWNGADVWVRCEDWTANRTTVTDYVGSTGQFVLNPPLANGFYPADVDHYYIRLNHVNCLDHQGEWAYRASDSQLFLYSTTNPTDSIIEVSSGGTLLTLNSGCSNIVVQNIHFTMSNNDGVYCSAANSIKINGCKFTYLVNGTYYRGSTGGIIENSYFQHCLEEGIDLHRASNMDVRDNQVYDVNMDVGTYSISAQSRGIAIVSEYTGGQYVGCDAVRVYRNRIERTASCGIVFSRSNNCAIDSNYVVDASWYLSDYGGIYNANNSKTYWMGSSTWVGNFVRNNFVDLTKTYSTMKGKNLASQTYQSVHCIYSDNYSENVFFENNMTIGGRSSLFSHWNDTLTYRNNIALNTTRIAFYISGRGRNYKVEGNTFISPLRQGYKTAIWPMYINNSTLEGGTFNNNNYLLPSGNYTTTGFIYWYNNGSATFSDIATWRATTVAGDGEQTDRLKFADVKLSTVDSMYFTYYNFSRTPVDLQNVLWSDYNFYDVAGNPVTNGEIAPYTGKVFIASQSSVKSLKIQSVSTNNLCFGDNTGAISVTASGGQAPYVYSWTGPGNFTSQNEDLASLTAGTYNLTVTDAASKTSSLQVTLSQPSQLAVAGVVTNAHTGQNNGAIDITVSEGTSPYTCNWVPGNLSSQDINGLARGIYTVMVTDSHNCSVIKDFTVDTIAANDPHTGIAQYFSNDELINITLYPLPAKDYLTVNLAFERRCKLNITLLNNLGEKIMNQEIAKPKGPLVYNLNTYGLQDGVYVVLFTIDNTLTVVKKMVKVNK